jgi:hypothetical protein
VSASTCAGAGNENRQGRELSQALSLPVVRWRIPFQGGPNQGPNQAGNPRTSTGQVLAGVIESLNSGEGSADDSWARDTAHGTRLVHGLLIRAPFRGEPLCASSSSFLS